MPPSISWIGKTGVKPDKRFGNTRQEMEGKQRNRTFWLKTQLASRGKGSEQNEGRKGECLGSQITLQLQLSRSYIRSYTLFHRERPDLMRNGVPAAPVCVDIEMMILIKKVAIRNEICSPLLRGCGNILSAHRFERNKNVCRGTVGVTSCKPLRSCCLLSASPPSYVSSLYMHQTILDSQFMNIQISSCLFNNCMTYNFKAPY